ncbi:MAG: zinc carboxypeptidase, partial [Bacteroidota bacterium]
DSVYYDASAWSLANFYNMAYSAVTTATLGKEVKSIDVTTKIPERSGYAYIMPWTDYSAPAALYQLQRHGVITTAAFKPFSMGDKDYGYGTVVIPVNRQKISSDSLYQVIKAVAAAWNVTIDKTETGYSQRGIDLGSGNLKFMQQPKVAMLVGQGVSSYEHGEVWHLMDTRVKMPVTKVPVRNFARLDLKQYNVMVLVSGAYNQIDSAGVARLRSWVSDGNTLVTSRGGSKWVIDQQIVKESFVKPEKKKTELTKRLPYVSAREHIGKKSVGGRFLRLIWILPTRLGSAIGWGKYLFTETVTSG